jgi:hypothetical protein
VYSQNFGGEGPAPGTTGKFLVLFRKEDGGQAAASALSDAAGLSAFPRKEHTETRRPPPPTPSPATGASTEFVRGCQEAVDHLAGRILAEPPGGAVAEELVPVTFDESELTWGLQATRSAVSQFGGRGVRSQRLECCGFSPSTPSGRSMVR